jgi:hypothetical protein
MKCPHPPNDLFNDKSAILPINVASKTYEQLEIHLKEIEKEI